MTDLGLSVNSQMLSTIAYLRKLTAEEFPGGSQQFRVAR